MYLVFVSVSVSFLFSFLVIKSKHFAVRNKMYGESFRRIFRAEKIFPPPPSVCEGPVKS